MNALKIQFDITHDGNKFRLDSYPNMGVITLYKLSVGSEAAKLIETPIVVKDVTTAELVVSIYCQLSKIVK